MADTEINFDAPAMLRKWPSVKKERVTTSLYIRPYLVVEGTLDECMREFMSSPHHRIICTKYIPRRKAN